MSKNEKQAEAIIEHGALGETVLEVRNVFKTYQVGEDIMVKALDGVSLQVRRGEMIAIIGPSGSGKSTLMHSIGLLDHPTSGQVLVGSVDVTDMGPNDLARVRNKEIGFVFQAFNLLSRTTAMENVELPLIYSGINAAERRRKSKQALEQVGLGDRLDHTPNQLSGGQQQRVAIARALVTEPAIVLADEPTGNLDSRSGIEVMAYLQKLNKEGKTIVLVTHDTRVAAHAHRVVEIADGRIVQDRIVDSAEHVDAQAELDELAARTAEGE